MNSIGERFDDEVLACLFRVFPSYYEGWGLPVGELKRVESIAHETAA